MRLLLTALAVLALGAASGCGEGNAGDSRAVVASFYPLAWATERVRPSSVDRVVDLTPPGAEPHDFELSPRDLEAILGAKLVVYISDGFQPAVAAAVARRRGPSLDVLGGDADPHIWLDPVRFSRVVEQIARALGHPGLASPTVRRLRGLDSQYRRELAHCERRTIVTTHASFGWLAARYRLTQIALTGRSPEAEPSPRSLVRVAHQIRASGATTVFTEPLVSSRVADTLAREAGVRVATLDPLEGLSKERLAAGADYFSVMRQNLATLREALGCR